MNDGMKEIMKKVNSEAAERRKRCIGFDVAFRTSLPKKFAISIFNSLPEDANLERIEENFNEGLWTFYISSLSFDVIDASKKIPRAVVKFEMNDDGSIKNVKFIDPFDQPVLPRQKLQKIEN